MFKNFIENKTLSFFVKTNGFFSKPLYSGIGHILCFHRVCPKKNNPRISQNAGMEITPEHLKFILEFFKKKNYQFISLDNYYETLTHNKKFKKKFVIVTFDDGFKDNYQFAFPLLKQLEVPFTIYISTSFPDRKAILWGYILEDLLLSENRIEFDFNNVNYNFDCKSMDEKEKVFNAIRKLIIDYENEKIPEILSEIIRTDEKKAFEYIDRNAVEWKQIIELSHSPLVTIGSHTISHYVLSKLSEKNAEIEILKSKKTIESHINKPVEHFAFPYGAKDDYGEREFKIIKQAGYKTAVTLSQGNVFCKSKNYLYSLPRIPLGENTTIEKLNYIINGIHHFGFNKFNRIIK